MLFTKFLKSKSQQYLQLIKGQTFLFSKSQKKYRQKFKLDYEYLASIPHHMRDDQLERIISLPKTNIQLSKDIPFFPINEYWDYHGTKLMMHFWQPPANVKARAVVVFFHSLNGHTGMCGELARQLVADGIIVAGFDFKNFGQSQGIYRGMLESFDELVSVSEQFTIKMKTKYANLKIFTCGMSMGGAIAFNISVKNPKLTNGLILLSPSIRQNHMHYPMLKKLTLLLSLAFPNQQLLKASGRNGSRYRLDDYSKKDPYLYQGRLWAKTVQQILLGMSKTKKLYKEISSPYLLIQSGSDKLVDPFACLDLQKLSPSQDKTTVIIHGMWHAVWFDDHVYDVIRIVEEWLQERI